MKHWLWLPITLLVVLGLLGGVVLLDLATSSAAQPPTSVQTMQDLRSWKQGGIRGQGTFTDNNGITYTVLLGQDARLLASGPSAYVFDGTGQLVDWTADMGDYYTIKHGFDLTSGHVTDIAWERP